MPREVMRVDDLRDAFSVLGWGPRHAYARRGRWVVIAGSRSATGPSIEMAFAALLALHAAGDA